MRKALVTLLLLTSFAGCGELEPTAAPTPLPIPTATPDPSVACADYGEKFDRFLDKLERLTVLDATDHQKNELLEVHEDVLDLDTWAALAALPIDLPLDADYETRVEAVLEFCIRLDQPAASRPSSVPTATPTPEPSPTQTPEPMQTPVPTRTPFPTSTSTPEPTMSESCAVENYHYRLHRNDPSVIVRFLDMHKNGLESIFTTSGNGGALFGMALGLEEAIEELMDFIVRDMGRNGPEEFKDLPSDYKKVLGIKVSIKENESIVISTLEGTFVHSLRRYASFVGSREDNYEVSREIANYLWDRMPEDVELEDAVEYYRANKRRFHIGSPYAEIDSRYAADGSRYFEHMIDLGSTAMKLKDRYDTVANRYLGQCNF